MLNSCNDLRCYFFVVNGGKKKVLEQRVVKGMTGTRGRWHLMSVHVRVEVRRRYNERIYLTEYELKKRGTLRHEVPSRLHQSKQRVRTYWDFVKQIWKSVELVIIKIPTHTDVRVVLSIEELPSPPVPKQRMSKMVKVSSHTKERVSSKSYLSVI